MSRRRFDQTQTGAPKRVRMDGTSASAAPDPERLAQKTRSQSAYDKYKEQLHELFDGKREMPGNLKEMLATRPGAEDHGFSSPESAAPSEPIAEKTKRNAAEKKTADKAKSSGRRRIMTTKNDRAEYVGALRKASSPREAEKAIDALRGAGYPLPLEIELLSKALGHSSEEVALSALRGLISIVEGPQEKGANLLRSRLQNVRIMFPSQEVESLCDDLETRLAGGA